MKRFLSLCAVLALMVLGGCSSGPSFSEPVAKVMGVKITQKTSEGARVEVTVQLENPNQVAVPLHDTRFRMWLANGGSFDFEDPSQRTLPAQGHQTLVLPAAFAAKDASIVGVGYKVDGFVRYERPGWIRRVLNEMDIPLPTTDFSSSGNLE